MVALADCLCGKDLESTISSECHSSEQWTLLRLALSQHLKNGRDTTWLSSRVDNPFYLLGGFHTFNLNIVGRDKTCFLKYLVFVINTVFVTWYYSIYNVIHFDF